MTTVTEKRWMGKQEAADYLGISTRSLRRLTEEGKLSFYKPRVGRTSYKREDLDAYMESTKVEG